MISAVNRVPVSWVHDRLKGPSPVLLACAYDDEEKCRSMRLPGSLTLQELNEHLPSLPKDQDLVFYCS